MLCEVGSLSVELLTIFVPRHPESLDVVGKITDVLFAFVEFPLKGIGIALGLLKAGNRDLQFVANSSHPVVVRAHGFKRPQVEFNQMIMDLASNRAAIGATGGNQLLKDPGVGRHALPTENA